MSDETFILAELAFVVVLFSAFLIWQFLDLKKAKAETARRKAEAARALGSPGEAPKPATPRPNEAA
jgi:hypothetical protein